MAKKEYELRFRLPEAFCVSKEEPEYLKMIDLSLKEADEYTMQFLNLKEVAEDFLSKKLDDPDHRILNKATKEDIIKYYNDNNMNLGDSLELVRNIYPNYLSINTSILLMTDGDINYDRQMEDTIQLLVSLSSQDYDNFTLKMKQEFRTKFVGEIIYPLLANSGIKQEDQKEIKQEIVQAFEEENLDIEQIRRIVTSKGDFKNSEYAVNILMGRYNTKEEYKDKVTNADKLFSLKGNETNIKNDSHLFKNVCGLNLNQQRKYSIIRRIYDYNKSYDTKQNEINEKAYFDTKRLVFHNLGLRGEALEKAIEKSKKEKDEKTREFYKTYNDKETVEAANKRHREDKAKLISKELKEYKEEMLGYKITIDSLISKDNPDPDNREK